MERTLKDRDIARMSALKAAVELTVAYKDAVVEQSKNATDVAIAAAEKFYKWILQPAQGDDRIGSQTDENGDERASWNELVRKECHALQTKLNMRLTNWQKDPCPWGTWTDGGAQYLLESLREKAKKNGDGKPNGKPEGNGKPKGSSKGLEKLAWDSGFEDRWQRGQPAAITVTQYGYAVSLYRKLGADHDPEFLNSLTAKQASAHIDELKAKLDS